MSDLTRQLFLAARLIRRIDAMGKTQEFEGTSLSDLAWACTKAANELKLVEIREQIMFRCEPDESAGMADVVELHGYSKRTPCA